LIRVEKITKSFGDLQVLKGINLEVPAGTSRSIPFKTRRSPNDFVIFSTLINRRFFKDWFYESNQIDSVRKI